jgi:hypothetical protein
VKVKVGDIYIRNLDGKVCKVKWIDHKRVVLESEDGNWVTLAEIFGLEKRYTKKGAKSPDLSHRFSTQG